MTKENIKKFSVYAPAFFVHADYHQKIAEKVMEEVAEGMCRVTNPCSPNWFIKHKNKTKRIGKSTRDILNLWLNDERIKKAA